MDASNHGIVWHPSPSLLAASNLTRFLRRHNLASLAALQHQSTTDLPWFWQSVLQELDIRFEHPYSTILDLSAGPAFPRWCVDGIMNIVTNCLDRYAGTPTDDKPALRYESEEGATQSLTYRELREQVNRGAAALLSLGLGPGDVVGVFMPMTPQIVIAMLAILKIGGTFLPLFSGYGPAAVAERLADAGAKALFTADAFPRRGKICPMKPVADEAAANVPSLKHLIVLRRTGAGVPWNPARDHWWHELMDLEFEISNLRSHPTAADATMMILYTSGTTGRPKGAVHTHCGFPIKAAQDILHGFDLHPDETLYWVTDMGWMMGPWLVFGTLLLGATMLLYDGALDYPAPDRLWALVERHRVTTLGISPTLVRALLPHGEEPVRRHDLSSLRKFGSTGEPWNPEPWLWLFHTAGGGRLPILNYSGGTEISGGILCGNVHTPLKPCSFSGPLPGIAADIVDDRGQPVPPGQVGELVIRQPWIGMTRGFWKDPQRYLDTYWSRFPGIWVHGDWATVDADGLWYILGRSDDTIKIAGKRLGPAEVESVLVSHPSVREAAAIGVPDEIKGQALVCFCVLNAGHQPSDALRGELQSLVSRDLGKALAPRDLKFARDLPKTRNAKVMRRVIRAAYLGQEPGDTSSLENPETVENIRQST